MENGSLFKMIYLSYLEGFDFQIFVSIVFVMMFLIGYFGSTVLFISVFFFKLSLKNIAILITEVKGSTGINPLG
jgi:hypothetical protein